MRRNDSNPVSTQCPRVCGVVSVDFERELGVVCLARLCFGELLRAQFSEANRTQKRTAVNYMCMYLSPPPCGEDAHQPWASGATTRSSQMFTGSEKEWKGRAKNIQKTHPSRRATTVALMSNSTGIILLPATGDSTAKIHCKSPDYSDYCNLRKNFDCLSLLSPLGVLRLLNPD